MRAPIFAAAFALTLLAPAIACADDYVFTVPVRIENAVGVQSALVDCQVDFQSGTVVSSVQQQTFVTVTNGNYVGNATMTVTTNSPRANAFRWSCTMAPVYNDGDGPSGYFPTTAGAEQWYADQSGRRVVRLVRVASGAIAP